MAKGIYVGVETTFPIYEEKVITVTITVDNISSYFKVTNESYYFEGNGSTFTTNNGGVHNSTAKTTLEALQDISSITFDYSYSSEGSYDKFTLQVAGAIVERAVSGGTTKKNYTGSLTKGQTIVFTYTKDKSQNGGLDRCDFSNMNITCIIKIQIGSETKDIARKVKKAYVGVKPLVNLIPDSSFENDKWAGANYSTAEKYNGSRSLYFPAETTYVANIEIPRPIIGHKYYGRRYIKSNGNNEPADCRFEVWGADGANMNWVYAWNNGNHPEWGFDSAIHEIAGVDYPETDRTIIRCFNVNTTADTWVDGLLLVDLTEYFGAGNEPTLEWCDTNIPYFDGEYAANYSQMGIARKVKKGYVGVGDIARQFYSGDPVLSYYGTITELRYSRQYLAATSVGDYALFGGGYDGSTYYTTVDTYTKTLVKGTATDLYVGKKSLAATTVGDYAIFACGNSGAVWHTKVDVYTSSLVHTTPSEISTTRQELAATTVGDYALFGGGVAREYYATVDTYTSSLVKGTATQLSSARSNLAATTVGNYALFAGGYYSATSDGRTKTVDTYSSTLVKGTATNLSTSNCRYLAATTVGDYALFGGGTHAGNSNIVDTYSSTLVKGTATNLSAKRYSLAATTVGGYALFGGGHTGVASAVIDAYTSSLVHNLPTVLSAARWSLVATSVGNYALFGGGYNGSNYQSAVDVYQAI